MPFDTSSKRRASKPVRVGNLVRERVAQLAAISGLSLKQQDLFDRNPGPWQFVDEDHPMGFDEIWERVAALNPQLKTPAAAINWSPDQLKRLCERFFQGGVEAERGKVLKAFEHAVGK